MARETDGDSDHPSKPKALIGWKRPSEHFKKLNTDGSLKRSTAQASTEGILRDESGRWIPGFTANLV